MAAVRSRGALAELACMDSKHHTALEFDGLVKHYRRQTVLDGLSLSVHQGECFGLVGVNGAGKTTCIKGLLDFCEIDGGTISIFDVPHTETRARSRLAYLPERFLPPYYLTGRDFLRYMSRLHGAAYDDSAACELCGELDLDREALGKSAREYSKGMAQKLGLVACFMYARDLVVLDEPMSGLDPKARILVKSYLGKLKQKGRTLFISTHMLSDVEELCDRMGVLHAKRLRFVGTPADCCRQYGTDKLEQAYLECIERGEP
jgi:ABC-2 type transport system ATP-binding protein